MAARHRATGNRLACHLAGGGRSAGEVEAQGGCPQPRIPSGEVGLDVGTSLSRRRAVPAPGTGVLGRRVAQPQLSSTVASILLWSVLPSARPGCSRTHAASATFMTDLPGAVLPLSLPLLYPLPLKINALQTFPFHTHVLLDSDTKRA